MNKQEKKCNKVSNITIGLKRTLSYLLVTVMIVGGHSTINVANGDTLDTNYGYLHTNEGTVDKNYGIVLENESFIINNFRTVNTDLHDNGRIYGCNDYASNQYCEVYTDNSHIILTGLTDGNSKKWI